MVRIFIFDCLFLKFLYQLHISFMPCIIALRNIFLLNPPQYRHTVTLMLALRARGLGSDWTILHLVYEQEVAEILGIPPTITQAALLPVAYYTGDDFQPAHRVLASTLTYWDRWGEKR